MFSESYEFALSFPARDALITETSEKDRDRREAFALAKLELLPLDVELPHAREPSPRGSRVRATAPARLDRLERLARRAHAHPFAFDALARPIPLRPRAFDEVHRARQKHRPVSHEEKLRARCSRCSRDFTSIAHEMMP